MRKKVVREQDRLSVLKVRAARHGNTEVLLGAGNENLDELRDHVVDDVCLVEQVGANQCCDLVVAAATGANLAAELRACDLDEAALEG